MKPQSPFPFTQPPAAAGGGRLSEGEAGGRVASSLSVEAPPTRGRRRHIAVSSVYLVAAGVAAGMLGWNAPGRSVRRVPTWRHEPDATERSTAG
jgi:hypothetical protein